MQKKTFSVRFDPNLHAAAKEQARNHAGVSLERFIAMAVYKALFPHYRAKVQVKP